LTTVTQCSNGHSFNSMATLSSANTLLFVCNIQFYLPCAALLTPVKGLHLQFATAQMVILGYSEKIKKSTALIANSVKIMGWWWWWDVMPHGLVNTNEHYTGTCCPHIQGRQNSSPNCLYLHGVTSPPYKRNGNSLTLQYMLNTKAKSKITCGYAAQ